MGAEQVAVGLRLLDTKQMARAFHVTDRTIFNWRHSDNFPRPMKVGRKLLWPEESVTAWIRRKYGEAFER